MRGKNATNDVMFHVLIIKGLWGKGLKNKSWNPSLYGGEFFSGVNIFSGVDIFQRGIFFKSEYFSGVNIFGV